MDWKVGAPYGQGMVLHDYFLVLEPGILLSRASRVFAFNTTTTDAAGFPRGVDLTRGDVNFGMGSSQ